MLAQVRHPPPAFCTIQQWEEVERTGRLQVVILSTMEFMVAGMRHHLAVARISQEAHQKAHRGYYSVTPGPTSGIWADGQFLGFSGPGDPPLSGLWHEAGHQWSASKTQL